MSKKISLLYYVILIVFAGIVTSCGENNIIIDDPNTLDPDIPVLDIDADDYIQEHLRSYDKDGINIKLKDDVRILTPYQLQHITAVNDDHTVLTFSGDVARLPKVGDKIVYSPYTIGTVPMLTPGCMGMVKEVKQSSRSGMSYDVCLEEESSIGLDEYYDVLEIETAPVVFRKINPGSDRIDTDYYYKLFSNEGSLYNQILPDNYLINGGFDLVGETELGIRAIFSASKREDFFDFTIQPVLKVKGDLGFKTGFEFGFDNANLKLFSAPVGVLGAIMVPVPLVFTLNLELYLYPLVEATAKISAVVNFERTLAEAHISQRHGRYSGYVDIPKKTDIEGWTFFETFNEIETEGKIGVGLRLYPTICVNQQKIVDPKFVFVDANLNLDSQYSIRLDKPAESDMIHNPINFGIQCGLYYKFEMNPFNLGQWTLEGEVVEFNHIFKELYLPPTYKGWGHKDDVNSGTTILSAFPSGDLLLPVRTGFTLYTGDVDPAKINGLTSIFRSQFSLGNVYPSWVETIAGKKGEQINAQISGLQEGSKYTAIPYIGFFGEMLNMSVYGDNYYTFTFGEESKRLLKSIDIPYSEGDAFGGGKIIYEYDEEGRLIEYGDPMTEIFMKLDHENKRIEIMEDGYTITGSFTTNDNGFLKSVTTYDEGERIYTTFDYNSDGYISKVNDNDGLNTSFTWNGGKLISINVNDDGNVSRVTFSYDKDIPNNQMQTWYYGNIYAYFMRAGLMGKTPTYLPTKMQNYDGESTYNLTFNFVLDTDGYIMTEEITSMGYTLPFNYNYE